MQTGISSTRQETLGARLERARLQAREHRLEHVVARLRERAAFSEGARLGHNGLARAAAEFADELERVRRRLRLLGDDR